MAPTEGKPTRRSKPDAFSTETDVAVETGVIPCDRWALCQDAISLAWVARDRCGSCALGGGVASSRSNDADVRGPRSADPARLVTADVFERLRNQDSANRGGGTSTS